MADIPQVPGILPEGLTETRFGLSYYEPDLRVLAEVVDLRRKSGELWGELTIRCNLEGVRGQLDGNRLRQGNFNFSSLTARASWARAIATMVPQELNDKLEWGNLLERICQSVLDHERVGAIHGVELTGTRAPNGGRPWAAWPILPHGDTATLFARGGAGKTSLVAMLAFGMALGRSIIPGVRVDRPYRTCILDWETNAETAQDLLGLIAETQQLEVPRGIWYEPMDAPLERSLQKVANVIDRHHADLVIVDSVTMSMISSADGAGDPADGITRVYQSLRRLNTWGLLIDHIAGGDLRSRRAAFKAYGSIFKLNLARHSVALHIGNRAGDTSQAYLLCPKSNVGRDRWAMPGTVLRNDDELRWSFGEQDYDLYDSLQHDSDPDDVPEEKNATPRQAALYLGVLASAHPNGLTVGEIKDRTGASSTQLVRNKLMILAKEGQVEAVTPQHGREKQWFITQAGINLRNAHADDNILPFPNRPDDGDL